MDAKLLKIAQHACASIQTLDTRNSDSLDFPSVAIWEIQAMLQAAYNAGVDSVRPRGSCKDSPCSCK